MIRRQRKPNRLKNFNYSLSGYYYVTICTKDRQKYFGKIVNSKMIINEYGKIINKYWKSIPNHYQNVLLDEFIIMPNHIHGIVVIIRLNNNNQSTVGTGHCPVPTMNIQNNHYGLLSKIINGFKNVSTKTIRKQTHSFQWQRSFYDHIIRNEESLNKIRQYIRENPINWDNDRNNLTKDDRISELNYMRIQEWFGENIGYRFFGCCYNKVHDPIFEFIKTKIPKDFLRRTIFDLGCGDGSNTLRIQQIFQTKKIVGYDHNDFLIERARKKGLNIIKLDFNKELPEEEMATFTFSLHHAKDKEKTLRDAVRKFDYIFLCEPILDLYHWLLDGGTPLSKQEWINIFNKILKTYQLFQYKNNLIIFYQNSS